MTLIFDHLAVGARNLAEGTAWASETLGIDMQMGGEHPLMGTHNRLTRTGDDNFFEVISVNPDAPAPARKRWYRMDDPAVNAALATGPKVLSWMVATSDIDGALSAARAAGLDLGEAVEVTRGDLKWRLSVRPDGDLPEGGTLPVFIQWQEGPHPALRMPDLGLRFAAIRLRHPEPKRLEGYLSVLGVSEMVRVEEAPEAGIAADMVRPDGGRVTLG